MTASAYRPLALALAAALPAAEAASLTPLPLPGGLIGGSGAALDISGDGSVIVGFGVSTAGATDALRWDRRMTGAWDATNLRPLIEGSLPTQPIIYSYERSEARAVSVHGNEVFIGGSFGAPFGPELGFRIGPTGTDYFGTDQNYPRAVNALSRDGSVVAGTGAFPVFAGGSFVGSSGPGAFMNFGGQADFFPPGLGGPANARSFGSGVSGDGNRLVGSFQERAPGGGFLPAQAFSFDPQAGVAVNLPRPTDPANPLVYLDNGTQAEAISADGSTIVGTYLGVGNGPPGAVLWRDSGAGGFTTQVLRAPPCPGCGPKGLEAVDVADDNTLVVGNGASPVSPTPSAIVWDTGPASGSSPEGRLLLDVLAGAGVNVSRWLGRFEAEAVSGNGRFVVGQGEFDLGGGVLQHIPWVADLAGTGLWNAPHRPRPRVRVIPFSGMRPSVRATLSP
ncbi:MAG TPA: hypothetical protein DCY89_08490 [Gammaproteobacteria bacterium]|nr:hypothetical protein [Gammaproteobacteria bacterium]